MKGIYPPSKADYISALTIFLHLKNWIILSIMIGPIAIPEQPESCESGIARNCKMNLTFSLWHNNPFVKKLLFSLN